MANSNGAGGWIKRSAAVIGLLVALLTIVGMLWAVTLRPQVREIAVEEAEKAMTREQRLREREMQTILQGQQRIESKVDQLQQYLLEHPR